MNDGFDFRDIIDEAEDIVMVTKAWPLSSPGPEIVYVNKAFTDLTGYSAAEAIGKNPRMLQSSGTDPAATSEIRTALESKESIRKIIKNFHKNGDEYWLDMNIIPLRNNAGEVTHFAAIERDITDQVILQLELERQSATDPLSGLLNRRAFNSVLDATTAKVIKTEGIYSIIMIDLDNFKWVNDTYGHDAGDHVIKSISVLCQRVFREQDHICRYGGDEIVVLLPNVRRKEAISVAERVRIQIDDLSVVTAGYDISVMASLGVSAFCGNDDQFLAVLKRVDNALYQAKADGRNRVRFN